MNYEDDINAFFNDKYEMKRVKKIIIVVSVIALIALLFIFYRPSPAPGAGGEVCYNVSQLEHINDSSLYYFTINSQRIVVFYTQSNTTYHVPVFFKSDNKAVVYFDLIFYNTIIPEQVENQILDYVAKHVQVKLLDASVKQVKVSRSIPDTVRFVFYLNLNDKKTRELISNGGVLVFEIVQKCGGKSVLVGEVEGVPMLIKSGGG